MVGESTSLLANTPPARKARPAAAVLCLALLGLAYSRTAKGSRVRAAGLSSSPDFPRPPTDDTAAPGDAVAFIDVTMDDFLAFPAVVDWLRRYVDDPVNASRSVEARGALLAYLPARLTIELDAAAVAGSLGRVAASGHVAFSLYLGTVASWTIVMSARGALERIAPGKSANSAGTSHFCALKNKDEDTLLLMSVVNNSASGYAFEWDWRGTGAYARVGGTRGGVWGTHDIQWAARRDGGARDAFWVSEAGHALPDYCAYDQNLTLVRADDGAILRKIALPGSSCGARAPDVNHHQLVADDAVALVSERNFASLAKFNLTDARGRDGAAAQQRARLAWRVGGPEGTWPIVDFDGTVHAAGATVWAQQHNPEFISDDEICMFDCTGLGNESRMLIVHVDEAAERATLRWQHRLGVLSQVYGDCDPLPSGNLLASYWKSEFSDSNSSADDDAVAGLVEVVRETNAVAWHMRVYGARCPTGDCENSNTEGWHMYSVER